MTASGVYNWRTRTWLCRLGVRKRYSSRLTDTLQTFASSPSGGVGSRGGGVGGRGCSPVWANHPQGLPSLSNRSSSSLSPWLVCSSNASSVPSQFRSCSPAACFARLIQRERWECRKWSDTDRRCSAMTIDRALCMWGWWWRWVSGWVGVVTRRGRHRKHARRLTRVVTVSAADPPLAVTVSG